MIKVLCLSLCIVLGNVLSVQAQNLRLLPEYVPCTYKGIRYACYDFDQQKQLNLLEKEALTYKSQVGSEKRIVKLHEDEVANLRKQLAEADKSIKMLVDHVADLKKDILKEIEDKNEWRAKAEKPRLFPWIFGGSMLAVALGLVAGTFLTK